MAVRIIVVCACGRTPLHCAASSNNLEAIRLLIEHGAGVLAFTWDTERETPLDKCCVDSPRYEQCYQFISGILRYLQLLFPYIAISLCDVSYVPSC